ncbi:M20 family metallopeptidase [Puniceicoccaceae bacterium K14]|nr:M20 family metallopeptidase [Puniceicoccaceae bacterium K14]
MALNQLLEDLVAIESVNPAYGGSGEAKVSEFVADYIRSLGLEPERQEVSPGRNNIFVRIGPTDQQTIMLEAHMDTVSVEGWASGSPFKLIESNGKLWGRGACDTKASLAVFMETLRYFATQADNLKYGLILAATVDEEATQSGAYALARLKGDLGVTAAITGEPTSCDVVHAHKGACHYKVVSKGKAAHGSTPELGQSAIYGVNRLIGRMEEIANQLAQDISIESGSLNVGLISGGSGFNIVPEYCEFHIDRRIGVGENLETVREELQEIVTRESGAEFETMLERPSLNTPADHWFAQEMSKSAQNIDPDRKLQSVAYMTNAVAYAEAAIPALVFGPGNIAQAHKCDEFIQIGEMEKALEILIDFLSV